MFFWSEEAAPGVWIAFTDRAAGNLAPGVGNDPDGAARNRAALESELGLQPGGLRFMKQTHSVVIAQAVPGAAPEADALISVTGTDALAVLVADCVPVVLTGEHDDGGVRTAVVHAGRRGVEGNIAGRAVEALEDAGARAVSAWIGPSICGGCYEVPADLQEQVAALVPQTHSTTRWGTSALDLPAGVRAQLLSAGAAVQAVGSGPSMCSLENPELFSHRAVPGGRAEGRMAGLVWRQ